MSKELLGSELYYRDLCEAYYGLSDKASSMKKLSLKLDTFKEELQTKKMSLIETLSSVAIGYIVKRIYYAN